MTVQLGAVVIGGSAGALDALGAILGALPASFSLPIAVVLHVPATMPSLLPDVIAQKCALSVREPVDKEPLAPSTVYLAAPGYHLLVEKERCFSFSVDDTVHFSRPSIDVLFESAAEAYGPQLVGIVLSGASEDGARGLAAVKDAGGTTLVQAPHTAAVRAMPEAALQTHAVDHTLPPHAIGAWLRQTQPHLEELSVR